MTIASITSDAPTITVSRSDIGRRFTTSAAAIRIRLKPRSHF